MRNISLLGQLTFQGLFSLVICFPIQTPVVDSRSFVLQWISNLVAVSYGRLGMMYLDIFEAKRDIQMLLPSEDLACCIFVGVVLVCHGFSHTTLITLLL